MYCLLNIYIYTYVYIYRERVTRGEQVTITLLSLLQTVPTTITSLALLSFTLYLSL